MIQGFPSLELFKQKGAGKSSPEGLVPQREAAGGARGRRGERVAVASKPPSELCVVFLGPLHAAAVLSPHRCPREGFPVFRMSLRAYQDHGFLEGLHTAWFFRAPGLTQMRQPRVWMAHTLAPQ